jgi:hypothetical protein
MCPPLIIPIVAYAAANAGVIAAGVSAASVAAGAVAAHQNASRTTDAANAANATANAGLIDQMHQRDAQATDQMTARSKQAMTTAGSLNAIFADSGVSGNSQDRIADVAAGNAQVDLTTIESNRQQASNQGTNEADALRAQAQARINSVPRPSVLGTGLQIGAAGLSAYDRMQNGNK